MKIGLPPVARPDAQLFVLGSLPGDASLAAQRYYAHPSNQFWRLVGDALGDDLQSLDYSQRLERLADWRIGLWDVIASATRSGSLDQAIRTPEHNLIHRLLHDYRQLEAIAFNGVAAAQIGRKLLGSGHGLTVVDLPSSSAANTMPYHLKAAAWSQLAHFAASKELPGA